MAKYAILHHPKTDCQMCLENGAGKYGCVGTTNTDCTHCNFYKAANEKDWSTSLLKIEFTIDIGQWDIITEALDKMVCDYDCKTRMSPRDSDQYEINAYKKNVVEQFANLIFDKVQYYKNAI